MSENGLSDISRIVSLIMENPRLIEEISNLARQDARTEPAQDVADEGTPTQGTAPEESAVSASAAPAPPTLPKPQGRAPRAQLLCALKPYVSKERASAIDSMISISEIFDMMRSR